MDLRTARRRLVRRIGRRGSTLLFLGLLSVLFSISLVNPATTQGSGAASIYRFIDGLVPLTTLAFIWGVVGVVCLYQAFIRQDRIAFSLSSALILGWGVLYASAWLFYGVDRAWVGAVIWLAFGGWIYIVSTWPEAP